jgi:hypothetical protein
MGWDEFRVLAYARLELPPNDVRLGYRISGETRRWMELTCQSDWNIVVSRMQEKAVVARKRAVGIELKNLVSDVFSSMTEALTLWLQKVQVQKIHEKGKKKEKHTREDDIPPEPMPEAKRQVENLCTLQQQWYCMAHSTLGVMTYCWIEPAEGSSKGGHREIPHSEMTLWAKYMVSKKS